MAAQSTYLDNKLLDHGNGVAAYALPTVWVGLCTTASTPAGQGAEATYTGYARVPLAGLMGAASGASAANTALITFPTCVAGTNTIVGFFTADSATIGGGNLLRYASCSGIVNPGQSPQFNIATLLTTMA
jgi:hypothetical protein